MILWRPHLGKKGREERPLELPGIAGPGEQTSSGDIPFNSWGEDRKLSLLVLVVLSLVIGYLAYVIFHPFLQALFVAVILAIAASPLHKWMSKKIRKRSLAALATTAVVILAVLLPFTIVSFKLAMEAAVNYRSFLEKLGNTVSWSSHLDPVINEVAEQTGLPSTQLKSEVVRRVRALQTKLITAVGTVAQRLAQQVLTVFLGAMFLYPLIRTGPELRAMVLGLLPLAPNRASEVIGAVNRGIIANIYGMLAVGIAEGILITIGFWLSGLRTPLLWGAIATVLSFLPYFGVSLVWMSGAIYLLLQEQWLHAIMLALWGVILVSAADGVVRGHVISGRVKTNSLIITLSLMGGLAVFGPIGFFVGPVTVVVLASLLRILREEHAALRQARNEAT